MSTRRRQKRKPASIAQCLNVGHQTPIHLSPVVKQNLIQLRAAILNAPTNLFHSTTEKHSFAEYKDRHAADYHLIPSFARSYIEQHVPTQSMHFVYAHSTSTQNPQKIEALFFIFEDRDVLRIPSWIQKMSQWLHVALQQPSQPGCRRPEHLQMTFFLTPMEKIMPHTANQIPHEEHINSGFTFSCRKHNQILLFRREDMFKVFLHETFHALGLDFSSRYGDAQADIDPPILRRFPGVSPHLDVSLFETYCEIWAQCIHLLWLTAPMESSASASASHPKSLDAFVRALQVDRRFVCYQTQKLLRHCYHRQSYRDLLKNRRASLPNEYKEKTNVFAYFVLRAGVLFCLDDFFGICGWKQPPSSSSSSQIPSLMIDYKTQVPALQSLIVDTSYKHPDLLAEMDFLIQKKTNDTCGKKTQRSARMTSYDILT